MIDTLCTGWMPDSLGVPPCLLAAAFLQCCNRLFDVEPDPTSDSYARWNFEPKNPAEWTWLGHR
jgi:hypothetical protein